MRDPTDAPAELIDRILASNCRVTARLDPQQSHVLLVYTAVPGSESYDKLQLLSVIGAQPRRGG